MCKCTGQSLSKHTHTLEQEERHILSARSLSGREQRISERASGFVREQRKSVREQGDSRSRIILIYFRATKMRSRHLAVK